MAYPRRYPKRKPAQPGNGPNPGQLKYLNDLIAKSGMSEREWQESVGLIEANMWGGRLRTEMITRANVSRWIDRLLNAGQSCTVKQPEM